jgi:hypothetical protein
VVDVHITFHVAAIVTMFGAIFAATVGQWFKKLGVQ